MKSILAVGDSLLAGHYGKSPLHYSTAVTGFNLINRSQNGEPMRGILRNMEVHLESSTPEILLLNGGANDLLIPYMKKNHGPAWTPFFRKLERHGSIAAADPQEFGKLLHQGITLGLEKNVRDIIILTIPVLSENLDHPLNRQKEILNREIRRILEDHFSKKRVYLADLAQDFEKTLQPLQPESNWFFRSPGDLEKDRTAPPAPDRRLSYTVDGAHLNEKGALLCSVVLDRILELLKD